MPKSTIKSEAVAAVEDAAPAAEPEVAVDPALDSEYQQFLAYRRGVVDARSLQNDVPPDTNGEFAARLKAKRAATKAAILAQDKRLVLVPRALTGGGSLPVIINGLRWEIESGKNVLVPNQIADMVENFIAANLDKRVVSGVFDG